MDSLEEMFLGATGIGSLPQVGYQQVPMEAFLGTEKVDPYSVDQYMETLEDDEGFIPVAKNLKRKIQKLEK